MSEPGQSRSARHLELLLGIVNNIDRILILPHNDPDPDAVASALALQYLLAERSNVASQIAYRGLIGRAENNGGCVLANVNISAVMVPGS